MRGKDKFYKPKTSAKRITPAYAGKSRHECKCRFFRRDHPRLCGEKDYPMKFVDVTAGSPPPMRGKDIKIEKGKRYCRITPAYAGKSVWLHWSTGAGEDHPRLCGEKFKIPVVVGYKNRITPAYAGKSIWELWDTFTIPGSPPPMRGKGKNIPCCSGLLRITPAYAGKSI